MRFDGGYDRMRGIAMPARRTAYGCSLFVAYGNLADPVFARNFDWDANPALLLFTDPPDGHASVSMVDISYLGISSERDLSSADGKRKLLNAPLIPFDGMNKRGLAIGLASVPSADPGKRPDRPTIGSLRIVRHVLDSCATVDQALRLFGRYNIDFDGGPALHYLVADARGDSAIVEFVSGQLVPTRTTRPWNAAVNFEMSTSSQQQRRSDWRYSKASRSLDNARGKLAWRDAMGLLRNIAQGHTQWSIVYGLKSGSIHLTTGKSWTRIHSFEL